MRNFTEWWAREDSNPHPGGYEPPALPIELRAQTKKILYSLKLRISSGIIVSMEIALLIVGLLITVGSLVFMWMLYKSMKKEKEDNAKN